MGKIYVGNLPWTTTEDQIKQHFTSIGNVRAVRIVTDKITGKSKGFAFVELENSEKAISELNGVDFGGRPLKINEAKEREFTPRTNAQPYRSPNTRQPNGNSIFSKSPYSRENGSNRLQESYR